jgi:hypothetical protein
MIDSNKAYSDERQCYVSITPLSITLQLTSHFLVATTFSAVTISNFINITTQDKRAPLLHAATH